MVQQAAFQGGRRQHVDRDVLLVLNIPLIGICVRILAISPRVLYPTGLVLVLIGVYSVNNTCSSRSYSG
jgi:TctA family transporter